MRGKKSIALFIKVRGLQTLGWLFGLSSPIKTPSTPTTEGRAFPDTRPCRSGRKRLGRATRLFLAILPRRLQGALGYPVCTNIGCSVSPGIYVNFCIAQGYTFANFLLF